MIVHGTKAQASHPRKFNLSERALFTTRMREIDREFARQTKQLTALTKRLSKRIITKL